MHSLKVRIVDEYHMPSICCACGAPAGRARFQVYASSWKSRRPFSIALPLCPACETAYTSVDRRRRLGCWIGLGAAALFGCAGLALPAMGPAAGTWSGPALLLAAIILLSGVAAFQLTPLLLSAQERAAYRQVTRAARIVDYHPSSYLGEGNMILLLAHGPFADRFRELNAPALWRERAA